MCSSSSSLRVHLHCVSSFLSSLWKSVVFGSVRSIQHSETNRTQNKIYSQHTQMRSSRKWIESGSTENIAIDAVITIITTTTVIAANIQQQNDENTSLCHGCEFWLGYNNVSILLHVCPIHFQLLLFFHTLPVNLLMHVEQKLTKKKKKSINTIVAGGLNFRLKSNGTP